MIAPAPAPIVVENGFLEGQFEAGVVLFHHRLAETGLFDDEALVELVASHPRECVNVSKPLEDAADYTWGEGDWSGVDPATLIDLVRRGRLWINVRHLVEHQRRYRKLVLDAYRELETKCPGLRTFNHYAGLLISSQTAKVPYHLDVPYVVLWHIRGSKRIWIYPEDDRRLMSYEEMEACITGRGTEDIPYDPAYDACAEVYDLHPGTALTWPQNAPHRVENLAGLNVSLTAEHETARARRKVRVHRANRFLRSTLGLPCRSPKIDGCGYWAKQFVYGAARGLDKLFGRPDPGHRQHRTTFRVDPNAPEGIAPIEADPVEAKPAEVASAV